MRDRGIETRIKRLEQTYGKINVTPFVKLS